MTSVSHSTLSLRTILEKDKLSGTNYMDWYRNLRIVLRQERKLYVLEEEAPEVPTENSSRADKDTYKKYTDDALDVECLMLATMNSELQKQHENMGCKEIDEHLKKMFQGQARQERFDVTKALFQCKMGVRDSVGTHVLKMIGYIENLERLSFPLGQELATDLILQSLPDSYEQFVLNYNMNEIDKTLPELLGMLRTAEINMKKAKPASPILMVHKGKSKAKGFKKMKVGPKSHLEPKSSALMKKKSTVKEGKCHHCGKTGHWRRNCPSYIESLQKMKGGMTSASSIYVIEINLSAPSSWVLDTGCGSHICTNVQELGRRRLLSKGEGTYALAMEQELLLLL
ncbi:hypothetical protein KSP39_PZI004223 [Platanthera zijinensis]|uniref:CCHC-type domain-containing protein n=1 Tax=Platanthera zijinensis TaxID=2320716 RepID=A0AAP0BVH6_9ASPA